MRNSLLFHGNEEAVGCNMDDGLNGIEIHGNSQQPGMLATALNGDFQPMILRNEKDAALNGDFQPMILRNETDGDSVQNSVAANEVANSGEFLKENIGFLGVVGSEPNITGIGPSLGQPKSILGAAGSGLSLGQPNLAIGAAHNINTLGLS
ncbi:carbohydrate-selective porin, OprB family [Corchorus capsularis]|uniref:Carbohydrate-selective porin, OprB family n=1 Tax=Corchorus capsularis TaxID=210143 RepID=A0A1R3JT03_COCAP|nr:carbohydrate-selective porin, OprB family [Corchorus capsularis]